jgi:hypothetical protein
MAAGPTIYYEAYYAASGGPGYPDACRDLMVTEENAPMTVCFDHEHEKWVVFDGTANAVLAEADNPRDLIGWMDEYLETLGSMKDDGEL